jgi:hypothetical protein
VVRMNVHLCHPVTGLVPVAWDWELEVRIVWCLALVRPRRRCRDLALWPLTVTLTHSSRHQYRQQQRHSGSCHGNWNKRKRELSSNLYSPVKYEERVVFRKYQILNTAECLYVQDFFPQTLHGWLAKMATVRFLRVSFVKCTADSRPSGLWQNTVRSEQFYLYLSFNVFSSGSNLGWDMLKIFS